MCSINFVQITYFSIIFKSHYVFRIKTGQLHKWYVTNSSKFRMKRALLPQIFFFHSFPYMKKKTTFFFVILE